MLYADIIVDISVENLDKTYQYSVPVEWMEEAVIGAPVEISFGMGNRILKGYIISLSDKPKIEVSRIKPINRVITEGVIIESHLIKLAYWIKDQYGATMNDALKTVIPIKKSVKSKEKKYVELRVNKEDAKVYLEDYKKDKRLTARVRLLEELIENGRLEQDVITAKLGISSSTMKTLEQLGVISIQTQTIYRNPVKDMELSKYKIVLNEEQRQIADEVIKEYDSGIRNTYLIHGITGSGKTEVYMEIIAAVIARGKQVIMLIPEIALTYQTVMRFYRKFGDRISIMNSRLSQGERYDQYLRAKKGEIDIMIGPRSALFTPFDHLGLIIIDEEHEGSYKSENPPKYHAREVAVERARLLGASVILGSATPSLEAYKKAMDGEYRLFELKNRAKQSILPKVYVEDLREELKQGNKSIFSRRLRAAMEERLRLNQQIMIFINRRGYAGFVSCRSCGHVMKCPHCDISLTSHNNGKVVCHYCGYEERFPKTCPACNSKYIAAFGTGTQKVEEFVKREFPTARVLRMDTDTTSTKDGHEKILAAFANHEADVLVGTQMIVKGHDFPLVTLVGIVAADLSLYSSDYRASERTFQLLLQASGRAGRGENMGEVVIQTYNPEHYSIEAAKNSNYEEFYSKEIAYRELMDYPPASHIMVVLVTSKDEEKAKKASELLSGAMKESFPQSQYQTYKLIGPTKANLSKINDIYRYVIYLKDKDYTMLKEVKNFLEAYISYSEYFKACNVQFDFDPMSGY